MVLAIFCQTALSDVARNSYCEKRWIRMPAFLWPCLPEFDFYDVFLFLIISVKWYTTIACILWYMVSGFRVFFSVLNIILATFWNNFCLKNIEYLLHFKYSLLTETLGITVDEKPEKSPTMDSLFWKKRIVNFTERWRKAHYNDTNIQKFIAACYYWRSFQLI